MGYAATATNRRPASNQHPQHVTAALAQHLDCSRAFLGKLEAEGVIHREPSGGLNLDRCQTAYIRPCAGLSNNHRSRKPSRAVLLIRLDALEVETTQTSEDREAATDCIDAATPDLSTRRSRTVLSWIAFGFQIELSGSSMLDSDFRKSAPKLCANWRRRRPIPFIKRRLLALISRYDDGVSARAPLMPKFQSQGTGSEQ